MTAEPLHLEPAAMLERLVAFDTVSSKPNLQLIEFVRGYLQAHGVECLVLPNDDSSKANLYARVGPTDIPAIGLSGHTDVVPVTGQEWTSDPFRLTQRDGKLYGRGTCDMKGFLAVCLSLVPDMIAAGLKTPIDLFLTHDEEVDCSGILRLVEDIGQRIPIPRAVIVGEPTMMCVVDAHKSAREYFTEVTGFEAHSSKMQMGASAISAGAMIVREIDRLRDRMILRGDASGRFDPPYSTIHIGTIAGGTAINIVPRHCLIHWEMRGLPDADTLEPMRHIDAFCEAEVVPLMRAVSPDTGVVTRSGVFVPGFASQAGSPAEQLAKRLARQNKTEAVSYITEAGYFQGAGAPTIVCGPGNIDQAHKGDEFLSIEQLENCCGFIRRLIAELSA